MLTDVSGTDAHAVIAHLQAIKIIGKKNLKNRSRDRHVSRSIRKKGRSVIRVWECRIHEKKTIKRTIRMLENKGFNKGCISKRT